MAEIIQKKKYSDLPKTTTLKDNDMVMVSDGTTSSAITVNNLKTEITKDIQVDTTNLATKEELNTGLGAKANVGHTHSEYATTTQLSTKADKVDTYTKTEVNALIDGVSTGDVDLTNYYNKLEVDTKDNLKVDKVAGKQLSTEDFTTAEKTKLSTLQNADVTKSYVDTELSKKSNTGHKHAKSEITDFPILHNVATSGDYNDLANKPTAYTLPAASTTVLGGVKVGAGLTITNGVLSTNGGGVADSVEWSNVQNKPTTFTPSVHNHTVAQVTGLQTALDDKSDLSHVHAYSSLTGRPTIPTTTSQLTNDSNFTTQTQVNSSITTGIGSSITSGDIKAALDLKVDKVTGKGLSQNDLTNTLKTNYDSAYTHSQQAHAPTNAEQNVQSDWNVTDNTSDAYIKNKPNIPDVSNYYNKAETDQKIADAVTGGTVDLSNYYTKQEAYSKTEVNTNMDLKVDKVAGKTLTTNDLTNTLKTNYDNAYAHSQSSHFSGSYADLTNKPSTFPPSTHSHAIGDLPTGTTGTTVALGNHNHSGVYEPVIANKGTAFNVNFETNATNVKMNGIQSVGSLQTIARVDHIHPNDTTKVDKVAGKSLISDTEITRLANVTNYTHPVNHPASVITQDANNRFVSDTQISAWNNAKATIDEHIANHPSGGGLGNITIVGDLDDIIPEQVVNVSSVSLDTNTINFNIGNTKQLVATVLPNNATNKNVTWTSSNSNVATVSSTGLVTAIGSGSTTITVTTVDGNKTATCSVTAAEEVTESKITLNKTTSTLTLGNGETLNATLSGSLIGKNVTWSSSDDGIVCVDGEGTLKAIGFGTTKIKAMVDDVFAECNVNVTDSIEAKPSNTVYVTNAGDDATGDGTQSKPYATLQKAISVINKATTSITLANGNWYELSQNVSDVYFVSGKGSLAEIALQSSCNFTNCIFDNVSVIPNSMSSTYNITGCIFKNNAYSSIFLKKSYITLNISNCRFKDVLPNAEEWIANTDWVRYWRFNPVNIYGSSVKLTLTDNVFSNNMSRVLIYFVENYTGSTLNATGNVFTKCEGNAICFESPLSGSIENNYFTFLGALRNSIGNTDEGMGVGGNAIFAHNDKATYNEMIIKNNHIVHVMENGIEGGHKEIAFNYIREPGYRLKEGYYNPSTEGIWGSAKNGIHHNTIINPKLSGIRIENYGKAGLTSTSCTDNVITLLEAGEEGNNQSGVSIVVKQVEDVGVTVKRNKIIGFPKISRIDNAGFSTSTFDIQTTSEEPTPPTEPPVNPPTFDGNYFDINNTLIEEKACSHTVDKSNKTVAVSSDFSVGYYGYLIWDIGTIREGRKYRLTCKCNESKTFVRFRVDGTQVAEQSLKTDYSLDFTGVNTQEKIVDICLGIRNLENLGEINAIFSEIQIIDLDGTPPEPPKGSITYDVVNYKIIVSDGTNTESYHSCDDVLKNHATLGGGVDGYKMVIKDRIKHYLSLTNGTSPSKITIDGMKPFDYSVIDPEYKKTWSNNGYAVYHNTLKYTIANKIDNDQWGVTDDRPVNQTALDRALSIYNCALPGYMEITYDPNSVNSVSEASFADTFLGVCRIGLYGGQKFHIHQNIRLLGGFGNSSRFYVGILVHELGHTTGIWDNSTHYPTTYTYNKNQENEWLQPSDIAHIKDKFPHLTGVTRTMQEVEKTSNNANVIFSFKHYKDESEMLNDADKVRVGEFEGIEGKLECEGLIYNLYKFKSGSENTIVKIHESIELGLAEGCSYKMYLNSNNYLLNPNETIRKEV